jgi:MFS family permease
MATLADMPDPHALLPVTVTAAFFSGMAPALVASARASLAERFQVDDRRAGSLTLALRLGMIPGMLTGGMTVDQGGSPALLIVASLVMAVGLSCLAVSRSLIQGLGAALVLGVSAGSLAIGSLMLMPQAFAPYGPPAALNLGTLFYTFGALLAGSLAERLARPWGWQRALLVIALFTLTPGLAAALSPIEAIGPPKGKVDQVFETLAFWLAGLFLVLYFPLQTGVAGGATRALTDLGHLPHLASLLTGCFWLAYLGARLGMGLILGGMDVPAAAEMWIVMALAIAAAVAIGNMAGTDRSTSGSLCLLAAGVSLGPLFPTVLGTLFVLFPGSRGTAIAAACAMGFLGDALLSPSIEGVARRAGVRVALRFGMVLALLLAAVALLLALLASSQGGRGA